MGALKMAEADLRRAILCDRRAELVGDQLAVDCDDCLAHWTGWHGMYITPLLSKRGWRTPARGDWGPGWPDLVLVSERRQRLVLAELKSDAGAERPEQTAVLAGLRRAGLEVHVWRPADLDSGAIMRALK